MTTSTIMNPTGAIGGGTSAAQVAPAKAAEAADHPGRWVGGAVGALASLAAALVAASLEGRSGNGSIFVDWVQIGLLGAPIGFVLGRQLLPLARGEGWNRAIGTGLLFAWAAPPLGAIEILGGSRLLDLGNVSSSVAGPLALALLPVALPVSFLAIFMTIPVGLAWGVLVRAVPAGALVALRAPLPLARLGVRHALVIIVVALLALELAVRS